MGNYCTNSRIYTVDYEIKIKGANDPEVCTKTIKIGNVPELRGSAHCVCSHSLPKIQHTPSSKAMCPRALPESKRSPKSEIKIKRAKGTPSNQEVSKSPMSRQWFMPREGSDKRILGNSGDNQLGGNGEGK